MIASEALSVQHDGENLLDQISFAIAPGEIVTIIGPNGGGKTTLLRALTGALRPSAGVIRRRPDLRIAYTPQKLAVDRTLPITVDGFLKLGARRADQKARRGAMERTGVAGRAQAQMSVLSGGEFQRVLLARALLRAPNLLILDEPTQALDHSGEARFYELVEALRAELNLAVLLVSHDLHVVMRASDRVICLNVRICCQGAPGVVSSHPEYHRLFGDPQRRALALYRHQHADDRNGCDEDCGRAAEGAGT